MSRPKTETFSAHSRASGNPAECSAPRAGSHGSPLSRGRADKRSRTRLIAAALAAAGFGGWLAGCSNADLYLDRRDNIALSGGDAVAGNTVGQMVDPWPPYSGNKNIAFNGEKMQQAAARYRTGKEIEPVDPENFMSTNQTGQTISTTVNNAAPAATTGGTPGQ
jgi:hypothetical protein